MYALNVNPPHTALFFSDALNEETIEFVIADMLGGGKVYLIGNAIEQAFNSGYADVHLGSGLSLSLMGLVLLT